MDDINKFNSVRFQSVEFSNRGMTLFGGKSKLHFVDKKGIRQITLKYGFQSERPIIEIAFGIFIVGLGIYFFANFILQILIYRIIYVEELLSLLLLPLGGWFIISGFQKRLYFEVIMDNDKRKFPLGKKHDRNELQKFLKLASQLGYVIDTTFLDKTN